MRASRPAISASAASGARLVTIAKSTQALCPMRSTYADSLAGFVRSLRLPHAHLLGHSFGGALVLEVYRRHPRVPISLILAGGYAGWAGSLQADEVTRRLHFADRSASMLSDGVFDPASMPGTFSDAMPIETARELSAIMADSRPAATRSMARALAEADLTGSLPPFPCRRFY